MNRAESIITLLIMYHPLSGLILNDHMVKEVIKVISL